LKEDAATDDRGSPRPAGTPLLTIAQCLQTETIKIAALAEGCQQMTCIDCEPVGSTAGQLAATLAQDTARWRKIVKPPPAQQG
jgi:hypothetical protein